MLRTVRVRGAGRGGCARIHLVGIFQLHAGEGGDFPPLGGIFQGGGDADIAVVGVGADGIAEVNAQRQPGLLCLGIELGEILKGIDNRGTGIVGEGLAVAGAEDAGEAGKGEDRRARRCRVGRRGRPRGWAGGEFWRCVPWDWWSGVT